MFKIVNSIIVSIITLACLNCIINCFQIDFILFFDKKTVLAKMILESFDSSIVSVITIACLDFIIYCFQNDFTLFFTIKQYYGKKV